MSNALLTVCRKEIVDNSRDRRTLFSVLLIGPVLIPMLWAFMLNVTVSRTFVGADGPINVPVVGQELAPNLIDFLNRQGIDANDEIASLDAAVAAVTAGDQDVVIVIDSEYPANFRAGGDARITVVVDESRTRTAGASRRIEAALNGYIARLQAMRLQARGISPLVLRPITVDEYDVSTAAGRSVVLLGFLSYLLMMSTFMGGFYLAIDSTAGERERGSLEPLLTVPVTRTSLLLGKLAATVFYMWLSLFLTVIGFSIALMFAPLESLGMSTSMGAGSVLKIFLVVAPFAPFGAALMMLVASFTRTYKEAQTYLGLVLLVPTMPLLIASALAVRPSLSLMLVPSLGQHLLVTEIIRAEPLDLLEIATSVVFTLAAGAVLAWIATRLYSREKLLG